MATRPARGGRLPPPPNAPTIEETPQEWPTGRDLTSLFTDLYELTMAASYLREGVTATATFSCFPRHLPPDRGFLVAAGLGEVLAFLQGLAVPAGTLELLARRGDVDPATLDALARLRFTGEVRAVAEGSVIGADTPLVEVTAPIAEAQLAETAVVSLLHYATAVASKAARCVLAAGGRPLIDFGARRAPGPEGALRATRAMAIAGVGATSNAAAAVALGIPAVGTMAHSYVSAFPSEAEAFAAFTRSFPDATVLLLDTYDTLAAVPRAVAVARHLAARGHRLRGVRLDSGDLLALSRGVRAALDAAGLGDVEILASGGIDEHEVARLLAAGAPIDAFALGTRLVMPADAPALDLAYKLVCYDGRDVLKLSPAKATWVAPKQVWRLRDGAGLIAADRLAAADEPPPARAEPLLATVMTGGRPVGPPPTLAEAAARCARELAALPPDARRLVAPVPLAAVPTDALRARQRAAEAEVRRREGLG